jgi:hypothetical protein
MQLTTTKLKLPRRWYDLPVPVACAISLLAVAGIIAAAGRIHTAPATVATATPALPTSQAIVVIQREQAPTALPAPMPTPDQAVYAELEQLRARVAELEAQPQPEAIEQPAQVIYVASEAVSTPEAPYAPTDAPLVAETEPTWATAPAVINPAHFVTVDPKKRCQFTGCL